MIAGKSLLGKPIIGQDDGAQVGMVRDLIFDHETDALLALVLSNRDLFGLIHATVVPWQSVLSASGDVIVVRNAGAKVNVADDERIRGVSKRETALSGTQVLDTDGQRLGTLADMCIDEHTGRVIGYEVSTGFVADTLHGKKFVPAPPGLAIGDNAAIAPPAAVAELKR